MLTDKIILKAGDKVDFFYPLHGQYLPHGERHVTVRKIDDSGFAGNDDARDGAYRRFEFWKVHNLTVQKPQGWFSQFVGLFH